MAHVVSQSLAVRADQPHDLTGTPSAHSSSPCPVEEPDPL